MADRRIGERRSPEKGVIKIQFKDAITYLIFAVIIIISVSANIILAIKLKTANQYISYYKNTAIEQSFNNAIKTTNTNETAK